MSQAILAGILTFLGVQSSEAHPNDPLSSEEISQSLSLFNQFMSESGGAIKQQRKKASVDTHEPLQHQHLKQPETLLIERHYEKNAPPEQRLADVYVYDYDTNELIESLIDINKLKVLSSKCKQGIQLPLSANEIKRAKQIVFEDEDERKILEDEYLRITSQRLMDTNELNIKAFTFTADSLPNRVNEASKLCGLHRCAQLVLYTKKNIVFEISLIVNLSVNVVTQRIGF